jgi:hypothetical protein
MALSASAMLAGRSEQSPVALAVALQLGEQQSKIRLNLRLAQRSGGMFYSSCWSANRDRA